MNKEQRVKYPCERDLMVYRMGLFPLVLERRDFCLFFSLATYFVETSEFSGEFFGSRSIYFSRIFMNRARCVCEELVMHLHSVNHFSSLSF